MSPDVHDTIVAIASPPGAAMRGVIRISGPNTLAVIRSAFELPVGDLSRAVYETKMCIGTSEQDGESLDLHGRLMVWPDERSYTRQPSAEFHMCGSQPLLDIATKRILECGARRAQPGEFTLRAFLSGRIDLTQAEAVLAVIDANSHIELDQALTQLAGGLAGPLVVLQEQLLLLLADIEAGLDFVDEDIEFVSMEVILDRLTSSRDSVRQTLDQLDSRQLHQQQVALVLVGKPNAGKSSLFNALAGKSASIVSEQLGTTRDYLVQELELGDQRVLLIDTAGIDPENVQSEIDAMAQDLAKRNSEHGTLRLICHDIQEPVSESVSFLDRRVTEEVGEIFLVTKSDLAPQPDSRVATIRAELNGHDESFETLAVWPVSTTEPDRLAEFRLKLERRVERILQSQLPMVASTALRAKDCLAAAEQSLFQALMAASENQGLELVASEIRQSLEQLAEVVGKVYTDDILDRIFSRFCIGK